MNRRNMLKTALASAATVSLGSAATSAMADEKIRLRMQSYWGKEAKDVFKSFTGNIKEATGGVIRIRRHEGGSIVPDAEMMSAVSKGTLDMAQGYGGYWPGKIDIAAIEAGLPGAWTDYEEAVHIFNEGGLLDLVREDYAKQGIHYLGPVFGGSYDLLTKKPVTSLDDLKEMKIRATPSIAKVLQELDIPTVFLPGSELYVGLSTGVIDGCIYGGPLEYKSMKLYETAPYYTSLHMINPGYADGVFFNKKKWDSLTDAQRKIIELAYQAHAMRMHAWIYAGNKEASESDLFKFSSLNAEDAARLQKASRVVWAEEAKKSERNKKAVEILKTAAEGRP